jgi:hypothetical protein
VRYQHERRQQRESKYVHTVTSWVASSHERGDDGSLSCPELRSGKIARRRAKAGGTACPTTEGVRR